MRRFLILLNLLLIQYHFSFSQNLIRNNSFENLKNENNTHLPNNYGQVDEMAFWETRTTAKKKNGDTILLHSPDWYKTGTTFTSQVNYIHPTVKNLPIDFSTIPAQHGRCYVGMGPCELIQQQLSKVPIKNKEYTVKIYIRPAKELGANWNVNTYLNIYLSKSKFKYTNNSANDFCQDNFCAKSGTGSSQLIMSKNITLSQYNYGNWYLLEQTFVVNDKDYEWVIIESQESVSPGNCRTYLLIDNVSLQRTCELSCNQSSGAINTPSYINNLGQWWGITGLDNVTDAVIDIYTLIGQTFVKRIYKNATNGIKDAIYWDGRDENNNPVAVAPYVARIYLKNDCDEKEFGQVISHQNINHNLAPPPNKNYYTGPVKIPRPCCAGMQDYYLSNVVLEAPYEWNYVIYGNLYLNNVTIQPGAIVNFQAGGDIYSGFTEITALPGVESFQYNTPCTPQRIYNDDGEEINWVGNEQERLANTEIYNWPQINNEVIIYPNPSNGIFNIVCSNNELFNLEVVSLQGNKILDTEFQGNHTLNLSHLNKGVYLIKIHGNDIMHTQKIIIQ